MSKSSKQRRSDDEFKPPSAKKAKQHVKTEAEHTSVQRIRLLDLIKYNYLSAGEEVFVKEQEGVITDRGTIKVLSSSGYIEYSNPTSWTKQVTGRENGGWGQIRLKSSKQTLSSIKEQYQKNVSSLEYIEDPDTSKSLISSYPAQDALNASPNTSQIETAPSDLTLPLKVRFINDEDRVFKIIWVSSDFKEFHTEYQGTLYTNLADFVNKIFEDFQKPANEQGVPPPGNLRFDELMYELSPGKWVRLAGNLFPSELMAQQGAQQNADYQQSLPLGSQPHLLQPHIQQHINFSHSTPSGDNCNHRNINNNNHCNNSTSGVDAHLNDSTASHNHNSSYDDYNVDDDNDAEDEFEGRRRSLTKSRGHHSGRRGVSTPCYKSLVFVEDAVYPVRVNAFGPLTVREILQIVFNECNLKHNNGTEADLVRDYTIDIEDYDFGGVKILFPKSVASFPTKCKIHIRRKEHMVNDTITSTTSTTSVGNDKQDTSFVDHDKSGILLMDNKEDEMDKEKGEELS